MVYGPMQWVKTGQVEISGVGEVQKFRILELRDLNLNGVFMYHLLPPRPPTLHLFWSLINAIGLIKFILLLEF